MQLVAIFQYNVNLNRDIPVHNMQAVRIFQYIINVRRDIPVHKYADSRDIFSTQICSQ
jgi:hypothetical protein